MQNKIQPVFIEKWEKSMLENHKENCQWGLENSTHTHNVFWNKVFTTLNIEQLWRLMKMAWERQLPFLALLKQMYHVFIEKKTRNKNLQNLLATDENGMSIRMLLP